MITAIAGVLEGTGPDWVDVAVGGVTLRMSVPGSAIASLGQTGNRVKLFTSLQVRDDSLTLYGFATEDERSAFGALVQINGVGPRVALSVLSTLSHDSLALAIAGGDPYAFRGVPGVGAKTANRIVLELKGKLVVGAVDSSELLGSEVVQALTALGYSIAEATEAASSVSGDSLSTEEHVRLALQQLSGTT